ncbi:hypothetical protein [Vibrio parahaemolyticus]|uniref:hypothetical protein n=1 Tax=Vibrio parahaemolyticus TaxID=670 RepID=UPI00235EA3AB|nr:hypothetical protein [Vibrio parahaemolyticus]
MTESQDKCFKNWKNKRQKGGAYYVFIQTLIIGGALFFGKLIGVALFTNQSQWGEFFTELPMTVTLILVVCIPLNAVSWFLGEWRYKNLSNKQEST